MIKYFQGNSILTVMKLVTPEKQLTCNTCGKLSIQNGKLEILKMTHSTEMTHSTAMTHSTEIYFSRILHGNVVDILD